MTSFNRRVKLTTHHQPPGKLFARMAKHHEKRLSRSHNLEDIACILDQELTPVLTRWLEPTTLSGDKLLAQQVSTLKLKMPAKHNQYSRCRASFLSF